MEAAIMANYAAPAQAIAAAVAEKYAEIIPVQGGKPAFPARLIAAPVRKPAASWAGQYAQQPNPVPAQCLRQVTQHLAAAEHALRIALARAKH